MKPLQSAVRTSILAPIAAATTARTAAIDCRGADYASVVFHISAEVNTSSTNVVLGLLEGDTSTGPWSTFNSAYAITADNTAARVVVFNVDMKGRKGFLQVTVTPGTNATNDPVITSCVAERVMETSNANSANANQVVVG